MPPGSSALVTNLTGWSNAAGGGVEVFRAANGSSYIEVDSTAAHDRIEQAVRTTAGSRYALSFRQSPMPGKSATTNRFDVFWNGSKVGSVSRSGTGLSAPSWQTTSFTVTATGNDRISFRENDRDNVGGLLDDVRLVTS